MGKSLKLGFIGTGGIALSYLKYLKAVEGAEVVAASDVNRLALNKAKQQCAVPHLYADYKAMLKKQKDIDAVIVCTPNGLHAETTIAALTAGKHVIVEKPMAMNANQAKAMLDAARKAGRKLIVGFQYRFDPRTQVIRQQIADGNFGKILYVRCQALRRRGIPNWGVFGRKELQGGGPLIDIGVHVLEMAHYAIGSPKPVSATGSTWTFAGNKPSKVASVWPNWDWKTYTVEDMAVGMIRFDNGALLTIEASFVAHIEKDVWNFHVMGENGGAVWDPVQLFKDQDGYMMNLSPAFVGPVGWDAIWALKVKHLVEVFRDGRRNEAPGEHGLMVQRMLDGVYASAAAGREVQID